MLMSPEQRAREFVTIGFHGLEIPSLEPYIKIITELIEGVENDVLDAAAQVCEREGVACLRDIVLGDKIGCREAFARAGALFSAATDICALRYNM